MYVRVCLYYTSIYFKFKTQHSQYTCSLRRLYEYTNCTTHILVYIYIYIYGDYDQLYEYYEVQIHVIQHILVNTGSAYILVQCMTMHCSVNTRIPILSKSRIAPYKTMQLQCTGGKYGCIVMFVHVCIVLRGTCKVLLSTTNTTSSLMYSYNA